LAHPEWRRAQSRKRHLRDRFGITPEDYDRMWEDQAGRCANPRCRAWYPRESEDYRTDALQVDHCHKTGALRGLLCPGCNNALGRIKDDVERLLGLVDYLRS
jgi:hypothetical protein